jgi:hypothetical protein
MVLATAGLAVDQELSRTSTLSTEVQLLHRRPLDTAPADPAPDPAARLLLARQSSAQLDLRLQTRLGLRDTLTAETSFAYERHTPGLELGWWQPQLTWRRRLAREHALSLAAGLVLTRSLTTSADVRSPDGLSPVGQLAYDGLLVRSRHHPLRSLLSLQVEHWIDPVLQTAGPRALLSARLILVATPRLTLSLDGRFAASLQRHPLPGSPDETLAAASLPLQYRASERITLETGVRWSDRAPHLRASPFDWHQRELWYYVTLTAAASTVPTPRPGPQLSP